MHFQFADDKKFIREESENKLAATFMVVCSFSSNRS